LPSGDEPRVDRVTELSNDDEVLECGLGDFETDFSIRDDRTGEPSRSGLAVG
jgi:hypothetical protein